MAAYGALLSLMNLIHDIQNHHSPPISLDTQQIESLTEKLTFLLGFLESYASPFADIDDEADPLEIRIADAAYAAEDVIESYIVDLIKMSRSRSTHEEETKSTFSRENDDSDEETSISGGEVKCREEVSCINLYEDLHQVIEEMDLINKVAVKIDAEKFPTSSASSFLSSSASSSLSSSAASFLSSSSPGASSSSTSMVCSDDVLHGIMEKLVAGGDRLAIPITGMGGIGKTTLARNLYAHQVIKEHFDICFWATISQQHNTKQILCELLRQKEDQSGRSVDELGLDLHKYLSGRRFLVVLDDMWSIDAWYEIQCFFPNNGNGSRILVTTRLSQLGSQFNNNYSLQMPFLDEVSSWDLFSKTVFGREACPLELVGIGKKIVENCRGLPLSIVVVGGLLKKLERTPRCWESIRNSLTSIVSLENDKHCLRLLKKSYDHLPLYLKPCFLYMGVFEEDCKIWSERLIRLWISEGFLKPINVKSLETIARGFLEELVDRNLILIDVTGSIKYCKIHDLVRELCLRESKKYGFYHVIGGEGSTPQGINSQRRVVIPRGTSKKKVRDGWQSISHTRSVICEKKEVPLCGNFGLVRTIDIPVFSELQSNLNAHVFECVNLRHLVVGVGSMSLLLSSVNVFWNLQTLIVRCYNECNAPIGIWKMYQLRHIEFIGYSILCVSDPPSEGKDDVVVMENLEIVSGVKNLKFSDGVVKRIPNVKKLGISFYGDDDDLYCLDNIKYLRKLESLNVLCDWKFASLHKLTFPHSLKTLTLDLGMNREFEWEKMMLERIGSLPLLERLLLSDGCFKRGKWEIGEDQFPCLKYLRLSMCYGLKEWTMAEESCSIFPCLEYLHLLYLEELKEIPREIGDIPTLREIKLVNCSESVVRSAKEIVEEQMEYQGQHLPFHVVVVTGSKYAAQQSLAGPNFVVEFDREPLHVSDPPSDGKDDVMVMKNPEILEGVTNFKFSDGVVKRIPNVKKLGIRYEDDDDDIYCLDNIKYLCKLESLDVLCDWKCASLHKLTFPHSLKTLTLALETNREFELEKMLGMIGSLPLLERLELGRGCFKTGKWEITEDQFPCLKGLILDQCYGLKQWTMAQESCFIFPRLEYLHLMYLEELKLEIPREIGDIPTLQKVRLVTCSESVVRSAKEILEEQMYEQGKQLPFHVQVLVPYKYAAQQSLAGPNFVVDVI